VFGDPFQGAKIRGYNGEIVTYCNAGDNVCTGNFEVTASHLSYSTGPAVSAFNRLANAYHARKGAGGGPAVSSDGGDSSDAGGDSGPVLGKGKGKGPGKGGAPKFGKGKGMGGAGRTVLDLTD